MNGPHDMGGMHGFGRVEPEANEPVFHADWEGTVFAAAAARSASRGLFNIDEFRHGIERMPPADYLPPATTSAGSAPLERILVEKGILTAQELPRRGPARRSTRTTARPSATIPALAEQPPARRQSLRAAYERDGPAPRFASATAS